MNEPNTNPVAPTDPAAGPDATGSWDIAVVSNSKPLPRLPSEGAATITRTEVSTPGPERPDRRTAAEDTEPLHATSSTGLPDIPGYHIEAEIGHGGIGNVYSAVNLTLNKTVALKVIYPRGRDKARLGGLFLREVQILAKLEHPHIVPIYAAGEWHGLPYFTMKLVPGGSLAAHRPRFVGDARAVARLVAKVARAIQYLHDHNIVHRDLKPLNILLAEDDEPLVADFGLAKFLGDPDPDLPTGPPLSFTGIPLGTKQYMAPEQTRGERTPFPKAVDVWALGITLYELLAGKRPFDDGPGDHLYDRIREDAPPPMPADVPRELEAVALKCLGKAPADRFATAGDVAEYLEAYLADRAPSHPLPEPPRPRAWPVAAGLLALMALVAIPAVLMTGGAKSAATVDDLLGAGRPATLIGAKGLPRFSWKNLPGSNCLLSTTRDGYCTVTSVGVGAIELHSAPLPLPVRLDFECAVAADRGPTTASGVYVARKETPATDGLHQTMIAFTRSESSYAKSPTKWAANLEMKLHFWMGSLPGDRTTLHQARPAIPMPQPRAEPALEWHKGSVTIWADRISGTWDGLPLGDTPITAREVEGPEVLGMLANRHNRARPGAGLAFTAPVFGPGLGLIVNHGETVFRNVHLVPTTP